MVHLIVGKPSDGPSLTQVIGTQKVDVCVCVFLLCCNADWKRKVSFQTLVLYNKFDCALKSVPRGSRFLEMLYCPMIEIRVRHLSIFWRSTTLLYWQLKDKEVVVVLSLLVILITSSSVSALQGLLNFHLKSTKFFEWDQQHPCHIHLLHCLHWRMQSVWLRLYQISTYQTAQTHPELYSCISRVTL